LGLRAEWTRRADRPEATESVLRGDLALQNNCSRADYRDRVDGIPPELRQMARLAQRCPIWFDGFAAEYFQRVHKARTRGYLRKLDLDRDDEPILTVPEVDVAEQEAPGWGARLLGMLSRAKAITPPPPPAAPAHLGTLELHLCRLGVYGERTASALTSFEAMRRDDPALARWYLRRRPEIFAPVEPGRVARAAKDRGLLKTLRSLPLASGGVDQHPKGMPLMATMREVARICARTAIARDLVTVVRTHQRLAADIETLAPIADLRVPKDERVKAKETAIALRDQAAIFMERLLDEQGGGGVARVVAQRLMGTRPVKATYRAPA